MKKRLDAFLILGCGGYQSKDGFLSCKSIENAIIDLSKIEDHKYDRLIDFLDRTAKLFDKPTLDYNKIVNILNFLYKVIEVIDEDMLINIQKFIRLHKECGLYLIVLMKEDYNV